MKKLLAIFYFLFFTIYFSFSQSVGIGTTAPDASAQLDITHTNKGLLIPRMTTSAIGLINNPARGLMVYDSVKNQLMVNMGTKSAPNWQTIAANSGWNLTGNTGTNPSFHFIGTNDNIPLRFRINNRWAGQVDSASRHVSLGLGAAQNNSSGLANIAIGNAAMKSNTTGSFNTVIGDSAAYTMNASDEGVFIGNFAGRNTTGFASYAVAIGTHAADSNCAAWSTIIGNYAGRKNHTEGNVMIGSAAGMNTLSGLATFVGDNAGLSNTTGSHNSFIGSKAGNLNTTGNYNTAVGAFSFYSNQTGARNTAVGTSSQYWNTANDNTALGFESSNQNTSGIRNTAVGSLALWRNQISSDNTAIGDSALYSNISSYGLNTAIGSQSLSSNTEGYANTATGAVALYYNTMGLDNTATGFFALLQNITGSENTAVGVAALGSNTIGSDNTALGVAADVTSGGFTNATAIGANALVNASNKMQLGNTVLSTIVTAGGYSIASDARFKDNVDDKTPGLSFIMQLHPVSYNFNYKRFDDFLQKDRKKKNNDADYGRQLLEKSSHKEIGFIAQDVEKLCADGHYTFNGVYAPQNENDNYSLDYSRFVVPLVRAIQEQQVIIENLKKPVESTPSAEVQAQIAKQNAIIEKQQAQINNLLRRLEALEKSK